MRQSDQITLTLKKEVIEKLHEVKKSSGTPMGKQIEKALEVVWQ